jgi:F420-dependent oxidoreductase-like protein
MYESQYSNRLECWTTISALAGATKKIRLGQLVMAAPFRPPALLAKMSATLDVITGGRLELGLGAGWHEGEFDSYGYNYGVWKDRIGKLEEAVQIIRLMWTQKSSNFNGTFYKINNAICEPKPVQDPHPPIMIAGGGERFTLRTVAKYADVCNFAEWTGTPEEYHHKLQVLNEHCNKVGRDPSEITKSWPAFVVIKKTKAEANLCTRKFIETYGRYPALNGTPEEIIDKIRDYSDQGISLFILSFLGGDFTKEAELFSEEVSQNI